MEFASMEQESAEQNFSECEKDLKGKKFVFTPYTDIVLLWAKTNYPESNWKQLTQIILRTYKLNLNQEICEERYKNYLEKTGISTKFKEFNESNEMISFLWENKKPEDFIHIYKELKRENDRIIKQKRRETSQKAIIYQSIYMEDKKKAKVLRQRSTQLKFYKPSLVSDEQIQARIQRLYSIIKQHCSDTILSEQSVLFSLMSDIFLKLVEVINQSVLSLQNSRKIEKYLIYDKEEIVEIIYKWRLFANVAQIILYFFAEDIHFNRKIKNISKWTEDIRDKETNNIEIENFAFGQSFEDFQIKILEDDLYNPIDGNSFTIKFEEEDKEYERMAQVKQEQHQEEEFLRKQEGQKEQEAHEDSYDRQETKYARKNEKTKKFAHKIQKIKEKSNQGLRSHKQRKNY